MMTLAPSKVSAEDLRAAIARSGIPAYVNAGRARVNPIRLSRIMRGHVRITDALASRILLAVEQEVAAHGR
jgi:UDP-N-acetylglucosamine enolpyruvyl transferase